jgi:hypothetical protein
MRERPASAGLLVLRSKPLFRRRSPQQRGATWRPDSSSISRRARTRGASCERNHGCQRRRRPSFRRNDRARHLLKAARGDEGYQQEEAHGDQEVENATCRVGQDAWLQRSRWRRDAGLTHQPHGIATAASVELEERVGERGAVATQLRENEMSGRVPFPDEPMSLVSSTGMSAHIAREAVGPRPAVGPGLPSGAT